MARLSRLVVAGQAHHVSLRAVAGNDAFVDAADHTLFFEALRRSAAEHRVAIHACVLLASEVQLLATPAAAEDLGRMMQALARFYVGPFNRRHGRSGALWQSRFRAAPVGGAAELLACMVYIEQAPRRAGVSGRVVDFAWSSAAHHAGIRSNPLLASVPPASAYWLLGNTPFEREAAYAALLESPLPAGEQARIEATTLKGWAMGSGEFIASLAAETPRRPVAQARGRPRKRI
ncbi:MAG: transposase [Burkholderiales bacterium]|nr:transposase [Burkholderiales bacterium]